MAKGYKQWTADDRNTIQRGLNAGVPDSSTPFPAAPGTLHRDKGWLWIPLRQARRDARAKPEEVVRRRLIRFLVEDLGYRPEQVDQERRTQAPARRQSAWSTFEAALFTPDAGVAMSDPSRGACLPEASVC